MILYFLSVCVMFLLVFLETQLEDLIGYILYVVENLNEKILVKDVDDKTNKCEMFVQLISRKLFC